MPELRKDPIIGRWVIISTERGKRPHDFKKVEEPAENPAECPFCAGREDSTPPEILALRSQGKPNGPGWQVRVIPSISPFLKRDAELWRKGIGLFDLIGARGSHEVVIETPQHIANMADLDSSQIEAVFSAYIQRTKELEKDEAIKYVLIFKNYGYKAGGSKIRHSRSQIIATPVNLKRVKEELEGARRYYDYHERCIFCDIIRQELEDGRRVVLEEDGIVAITPFAPRFPFEVWILPKKHRPDFSRIDEEEKKNLAAVLKKILTKLKSLLNDPPYNYVFHTAPFRREHKGYWTTIEDDYHWHIEIIPRLTQVAGFEWGTGFYICPVPSEEAAKYLREEK